jgi:hypothetical protein
MLVIWLIADPGVREGNEAEEAKEDKEGKEGKERKQEKEAPDSFQILLKRPPAWSLEWSAAPAQINYYVMTKAQNPRDSQSQKFLRGTEISYGNHIVLSPPAPGEIVIVLNVFNKNENISTTSIKSKDERATQ